MSCGGAVQMLFEVYPSRSWSIAVFGAGHVSQALVRLLTLLECQVVCIDSRPEWLARLPTARNLRLVQAPGLDDYARTQVPAGTYCISVTQGHALDLPILCALLPREDLPYVGVIGSSVKGRRLRADLGRAGLDAAHVARLHCPIGLEIGSNHPGDIAVSIAAQLLQTRDALQPHRRKSTRPAPAAPSPQLPAQKSQVPISATVPT